MFKVVVFAILLPFAINSHALTIAEKRAKATWEESLKSYIALAKIKCDVDIPGTIDDQLVPPFVAARRQVGSYCGATYEALRNLCEDPIAKTEVAKRIKSVKCVLGKTKDVEAKLEGTTLVVSFVVESVNIAAKVMKYLKASI